VTADIPSVWQGFVQKAHQLTPWVWCWRITLRSTPASTPTCYLVNHPEEVTVDGDTYRPFPVLHSALEQNSDGDLPQMEIQIDNSSKLVAPYVDQGGGFLDRDVKATLVNTDDLTQSFSFYFKVAGCTLTTTAATLRLEIDNWFQRKIPVDTFNIVRCRHRFGGPRCKYLVNDLAAYTDCGKTITDCKARHADMIARNLGANVLSSYGAFLGIPQQ
jgi:hypothetical protein